MMDASTLVTSGVIDVDAAVDSLPANAWSGDGRSLAVRVLRGEPEAGVASLDVAAGTVAWLRWSAQEEYVYPIGWDAAERLLALRVVYRAGGAASTLETISEDGSSSVAVFADDPDSFGVGLPAVARDLARTWSVASTPGPPLFIPLVVRVMLAGAALTVVLRLSGRLGAATRRRGTPLRLWAHRLF